MPKSEKRITLSEMIDMEKAIEALANGDEESKSILKAVCSVTPFSLLYFCIMDVYGIYGKNIPRIYTACLENIDYFMETIKALFEKEITKEELIKACPEWD